jgi:serine/threonine protein kinase
MKFLGSGGSADVYLVKKKNIETKFAMKVFKEKDEKGIQAEISVGFYILRELFFVGKNRQLNSPYLVRVFDSFERGIFL